MTFIPGDRLVRKDTDGPVGRCLEVNGSVVTMYWGTLGDAFITREGLDNVRRVPGDRSVRPCAGCAQAWVTRADLNDADVLCDNCREKVE